MEPRLGSGSGLGGGGDGADPRVRQTERECETDRQASGVSASPSPAPTSLPSWRSVLPPLHPPARFSSLHLSQCHGVALCRAHTTRTRAHRHGRTWLHLPSHFPRRHLPCTDLPDTPLSRPGDGGGAVWKGSLSPCALLVPPSQGCLFPEALGRGPRRRRPRFHLPPSQLGGFNSGTRCAQMCWGGAGVSVCTGVHACVRGPQACASSAEVWGACVSYVVCGGGFEGASASACFTVQLSVPCCVSHNGGLGPGPCLLSSPPCQ